MLHKVLHGLVTATSTSPRNKLTTALTTRAQSYFRTKFPSFSQRSSVACHPSTGFASRCGTVHVSCLSSNRLRPCSSRHGLSTSYTLPTNIIAWALLYGYHGKCYRVRLSELRVQTSSSSYSSSCKIFAANDLNLSTVTRPSPF